MAEREPLVRAPVGRWTELRQYVAAKDHVKEIENRAPMDWHGQALGPETAMSLAVRDRHLKQLEALRWGAALRERVDAHAANDE